MITDNDPIVIVDDDDFTALDAVLSIGRAIIVAVLPLLALSAAVEERWALVTAYTPSIRGGGAGTGLTSLGARTEARPYGIAACPTMLPYGARVYVPGYRDDPEKGGPWWTVDDTGGAMRQSARRGVLHLDVRMRSERSARQWGARWVRVLIHVPDRR